MIHLDDELKRVQFDSCIESVYDGSFKQACHVKCVSNNTSRIACEILVFTNVSAGGRCTNVKETLT